MLLPTSNIIHSSIPSIRLPTHHSIYLSIYPFIHPSRPLIHLPTHHSIYLPSIYPIRTFTHPIVRLATYHSICSSISYLSIYLVRSYTHTSVPLSVFLPTHHSVHLPISCFTHPSRLSLPKKNIIGAKRPLDEMTRLIGAKLTHP